MIQWAKILALGVPLVCAACIFQNRKTASTSTPKNLVVTSARTLSVVKDVDSARAVAMQLGYLGPDRCQGGIKGGEVVFWANGGTIDAFAPGNGRGADAELGQASGNLVARDGGIFFDQKQQFERAIPPGVGPSPRPASGYTEKSTWEFRSYLSAVCSVAFNLDQAMPQSPYQKISAEIVAAEFGTAGLKAAASDLFHLSLSGRTDHGIDAKMDIYLKKGFGLVALEYYQSGPETLLFHLYINDQGGLSVGSGPTDSPELQAMHAAMKAQCDRVNAYCDLLGGVPVEADCRVLQCLVPDLSITTEDACKAAKLDWHYNERVGRRACEDNRMFWADTEHPEYLAKDACEKNSFKWITVGGKSSCWHSEWISLSR